MDPRSLLCLLAFVACLALVRCQEKKEITIDAAYGYKDDVDVNVVHFLSGDYVHVFKGFFLMANKTLNKTELGFPMNMKIQAAYIPKGNSNRRVLYGKESGLSVRYEADGTVTSRQFRYGKHRAFLQNGGPDAVEVLDGKTYFFKGCKVSIMHKWNDWSEPQDIQEVVPEFPCNLDAAFSLNECMYIVKGVETYRWCTSGVRGPYNLNELLPLLDNWVIKAKSDGE